MLLPDNIYPENSIYFNGAIVLQSLQDKDQLDIFELYHKTKNVKDMSFPIFILCLDWLYLINAAEIKNKKVTLCS